MKIERKTRLEFDARRSRRNERKRKTHLSNDGSPKERSDPSSLVDVFGEVFRDSKEPSVLGLGIGRGVGVGEDVGHQMGEESGRKC